MARKPKTPAKYTPGTSSYINECNRLSTQLTHSCYREDRTFEEILQGAPPEMVAAVLADALAGTGRVADMNKEGREGAEANLEPLRISEGRLRLGRDGKRVCAPGARCSLRNPSL